MSKQPIYFNSYEDAVFVIRNKRHEITFYFHHPLLIVTNIPKGTYARTITGIKDGYTSVLIAKSFATIWRNVLAFIGDETEPMDFIDLNDTHGVDSKAIALKLKVIDEQMRILGDDGQPIWSQP